LNHVVKSYENYCTLKLLLGHMLCENLKERKTPFIVSCPKSLCCHKTQFKALGVNPWNILVTKKGFENHSLICWVSNSTTAYRKISSHYYKVLPIYTIEMGLSVVDGPSSLQEGTLLACIPKSKLANEVSLCSHWDNTFYF